MPTNTSENTRARILSFLRRQPRPTSAKALGQVLGLDRGTLYPILSRMEEDGDLVAGLRDGYRVFVMSAGARLESVGLMLDAADTYEIRRLNDSLSTLARGLDRLTSVIERLSNH